MKDSDDLKKLSLYIFKSPVMKTALVVFTLCILVTGVVFVLVNPGDKIAKGIRINGIDISGMSVSEAKNATSAVDALDEQEITIYSGNGKTSFKGLDILLSYDAEKTAKRAFSVGRSGNFFKNIKELVWLYFKPTDFNYVCSYDREKLSEIIYSFGTEINGEKKNYILEFSGDFVSVKKGIAGQSRNTDRAVMDFESAASRGIYNIYVHLEREEPHIPDIESLYKEIYIEPADAYYEVSGGEVRIYADIIGRQIDKIEAGTQISRLKNGETVTLKLVWLKPKVTLEDLEKQLFNHVLSQYSTAYNSSDKGRRTNVELAASRINEIVLAPGEVFSFNEAVGPRTKTAGFREAPVFENGETVQGTGGGVCQVSSTLYSAVLYADMKIIERRNHSMTVAYVPKGQDATVSYGAIDFKFKNSTAYPIKIVSAAGGGKLTISVHGTKPTKEKTVKIVNNLIETQNPTVEEIQDKELLVGTKKVVSAGKTGYRVETTRIVLENGVEVKNELVGVSVYKMIPTKLAIGAKVPDALPPLPTPEVTPPPEQIREENLQNGE